MSSWSLVTCRSGVVDLAAVRREDGSLVVPDALAAYDGLATAMEDWDVLAPALRDLDPWSLTPLRDAEVVAPLAGAHKLLCVGANYRDHIAEMGALSVPESWTPFFFLVPPSTTMVGDGQAIVIPADPAYQVDWEAELAVVIGRGGRDITEADALDHVAGYACFSDITARGLLRRNETLAEPFRWDWAGSKGLDTFCPMGPITPSWMVGDPGALGVRCLVNGVVKQDSTTANLISSVPEIVAAASRTWTLEPGDVIATGTPAGVGHPRGERLVDGDEVRVEITGLVPLTNPVTERVTAAAATAAR